MHPTAAIHDRHPDLTGLPARVLIDQLFQGRGVIDFNEAASALELLTHREGARLIDALLAAGLVLLDQERGLVRRASQ
ncbi:MAG: hypothetical protein AAF196_08890 [Planctomycetota bacterium]